MACDGPGRWFFSELTVQRFLDRVRGHLPVRALVEGERVAGGVAWALSHRDERTGLVDRVRAGRAGAMPACRTRPTVQLCDLWFERARVAGYLKV
jgi:hypothetical protein